MIKFCFGYTLLIFLVCCTSDRSGSTIKKIQKIDFLRGENTITIENSNDVSVRFTLKINDFFPVTFNDLVEVIQKLSKEKNISLEEASWLYIYKNTIHTEPYSTRNWQHDVILNINSLGGGWCDDRASVLASLWNKLGFKSRLIGLEGHIVPEVFSDGKWKMFDPDNGVFYCDGKGIVMSVDELEKDSSSFFLNSCSQEFNPIFKYKNPFSQSFIDYYSSEENNNDVSTWHKNQDFEEKDFVIPSNSSLEISFNGANICAIRVKLTPKSKGTLQMPFVLFSAMGNFSATLNKKNTLIHDSNYIFPDTSFRSAIVINNVKTNSEINYLVNPKLVILRNEKNNIELNSTKPLKIETQKLNVLSFTFDETDLFFDLKSEEYSDFLTKLSDYKEEKIDVNFILYQFRQFISLDSNLSFDDQSALKLQFEKELIALLKNPKNLTILKQQYPKSAFNLFIAAKYNKMENVKKRL